MYISNKSLPLKAILLAGITISDISHLSPALATDHPYLNSEQIKSSLIGNSVQHAASDSGSAYIVYYPEYGTLIGAAGPWGIFNDRGRWSVTNGLYCAQWNRWRDNQTICYRVVLQNRRIHWITQKGNREIIDQLLPGNPGKLQ